MKKLVLLAFLMMVAVVAAFSQEKSERESSTNGEKFGFGDQFKKNAPLKLKIPESLKTDSSQVFVPRSLYTERQLTLHSGTNFRVELPFVELPDPQSRMPIKEFGDSVNYTMQIKKYP
ncbi:hypothetical protein J0A67_20145 [Algoriphagus aestuariicola]|uniref:DUF4138 domain-containing protein n=1 Tax=Algoriphagus aestuariicola TaxID=1852016 RepID=A0ABS3BVU2_9BACT|nr:hypothetical protein [Algoriphagus aestuariicola]MBN7803197.1 hypothetical protein [Algoriphagus aestuariicola]